MAIKRNTAQLSLAAGTTVNTTTAGAPDAFTVATVGGTGSITSQDQTVPNTKEVIRVHSDGTTTTYFGWTGIDAAAVALRAAWIMKMPSALPSGNTILLNIRSNGGGTSHGNLAWTSAGLLSYISDAGGTTDPGTTALTVSTEYLCLLRMRNQTGTTTDTLVLEVYDSSGTLVTGAGLNLSARNFGATAPGTTRFGKNTAATTMGDIDFSYLTVETSTSPFTTMLALPGSNALPTITAPADIYSPVGTPISVAWTFADADGTVVSVTPTQTEGPTLALTGSGTGPFTATPSTPGVYKYSAVATDDLGGVSATPAVANVYIYSPTGNVSPYGFKNNTGSWVPVGVADLVSAVTLPSTSDYIETPTAPANAPITYLMNPYRPGAATINVNARLAPTAGAASTLLVELLQGAADTVVASTTITLADTFNITPWILNSGELAAWTNRKQWAIRLTGNQT